MKQFYLFSLFLVSNSIFSQNGVNTEIANALTIDFPVQPEISNEQGETVYFAVDTIGYYIASVKGFSINPIPKGELDEFYDGYIEGAINASGGNIISKKNIEIDGYPGLQIEYATSSNPQLPIKRFKNIVFAHPNLIAFDFWPITEDQKALQRAKNTFFNSASIQSTPTENNVVANIELNDAYKSSNPAYNIGYFVGQALFYLLILGAIFFIIRYIVKKSK